LIDRWLSDKRADIQLLGLINLDINQ
jgi:hypothetical protein